MLPTKPGFSMAQHSVFPELDGSVHPATAHHPVLTRAAPALHKLLMKTGVRPGWTYPRRELDKRVEE